MNGALANATYGDRVLVLALPILASEHTSVRSEFVLEVIAATRGERVGHSGRDLHPTTSQERRQKLAQPAHTAQRAADYGALPSNWHSAPTLIAHSAFDQSGNGAPVFMVTHEPIKKLVKEEPCRHQS